MYKAFFEFSERPFKLVPDPAYFFLGPSHEEALAHLEFAVRQGEGFTLITGEVGTGKTTLCRRFLENLDKNTEVAYIFNPVLEVLELLKSINEEYGISSTADFPRDLINRLNTFLLEMKARNRRVILLIDEAQNLTAEVLEQLRLLSNLETTRSKLLQIILVGQPELNDLLSSYKLRQLGQRISLSCRLLPLTHLETQQYIIHRISIVSNRSEAIFSTAAMGEIHSFSGGIPRLINTACDRSLLVAFSQNEGHVSGRSARLAVKELRNQQRRHPFRDRFRYSFRNPARFLWIWILLGIGCLALIGLWPCRRCWRLTPHQDRSLLSWLANWLNRSRYHLLFASRYPQHQTLLHRTCRMLGCWRLYPFPLIGVHQIRVPLTRIHHRLRILLSRIRFLTG